MTRKHKHEPIWKSLGEFAEEGIVLAVPLCFPGQSSPPPAGETAITTLTQGAGGTVYLGTAGSRAHLMAALIYGDTGVVLEMGVIPGATRIEAITTAGDELFILACGEGGTTLWTAPRFARSFLIQEWGMSRPQIEKVADVLDAPALGCVVTRDGRTVYGLTQDGRLFRLEAGAGSVEQIGQADEHGRHECRLGIDTTGRVWGSSGNAELWVYDRGAGEIRHTRIRVPAAAGRAQHTHVSAWAADDHTGVLYGGTYPDGFVFKLLCDEGKAVALGKPTRCDEVACMTVGHDGRLFGIAGAEDDLAHLFCYDPAEGSLRDLGIPVSTLTARQYGYHFASAITGRHGEIYFGQNERVNHLWIYCPPVPRRTTPRTSQQG